VRIGFDLDGTLDRPAVLEFAKILLAAGVELHVITGVFPEAIGWQDASAKRKKMERLGLKFVEQRTFGRRGYTEGAPPGAGQVTLHVLDAVPSTFDRDYRLSDLGLRKGALCEELGITLFIEDSTLYAEMIPKMSGGTTVLLIK
jgi:hypothetical protein